jgi:hypothetical protein
MEALSWLFPNLAPLVAILSWEDRENFISSETVGWGAGLGRTTTRLPEVGKSMSSLGPGCRMTRAKPAGAQAPPVDAHSGQIQEGSRIWGVELTALQALCLKFQTGPLSHRVCYYRELAFKEPKGPKALSSRMLTLRSEGRAGSLCGIQVEVHIHGTGAHTRWTRKPFSLTKLRVLGPTMEGTLLC